MRPRPMAPEELEDLRRAAIAAGWTLREGERTGVHVAKRGGCTKYNASEDELLRDVARATTPSAAGWKLPTPETGVGGGSGGRGESQNGRAAHDFSPAKGVPDGTLGDSSGGKHLSGEKGRLFGGVSGVSVVSDREPCRCSPGCTCNEPDVPLTGLGLPCGRCVYQCSCPGSGSSGDESNRLSPHYRLPGRGRRV